MKKLIALLALTLSTLSTLAHADVVDWPLSYDGQSTNTFIWVKGRHRWIGRSAGSCVRGGKALRQRIGMRGARLS